MAKKKIPALNIEHINNPTNFVFLSLIEYKRETYLGIIDFIKSDEMGAYILDYADQERVNTPEFLQVATRWYYKSSDTSPLSVEIARLGLTPQCSKIYRTFDTSYVSRIVGQGFKFDSLEKVKVKRRKILAIPDTVEVVIKRGNARITASPSELNVTV